MSQGLFGQAESASQTSRILGRRDHLTFRGNIATGRHGWLRLTPAYSLGLVQELLAGLGPHDTVLEPFSGTGTAALACASAGIRCHAVDINPFLCWLGNLKLTPFGNGMGPAVKAASAEIVANLVKPGANTWKPDLHQIEKWWDAPTLGALAMIRDGIQKTGRDAEPGLPDLLNIAFCKVMIQTANVSFGHQSMSFKKNEDKDQGELLGETPGDCVRRVANEFYASARDVAGSLALDPPIVGSHVLLGDSCDLPSVLTDRSYNAVITSPPYPNRMSYIRELRPYMYWLGYLSDGRAAGELDWQAIGGTWGSATSKLSSWSPAESARIPFPEFERIVGDIGHGHPLLGRYVHKYFEDIKRHILGLAEVLAPRARCHYIVGNSKFYDTVLPVEEIYAALFRDAGFVDVSVEPIRKRTSKKELYEFIVHAHQP